MELLVGFVSVFVLLLVTHAIIAMVKGLKEKDEGQP